METKHSPSPWKWSFESASKEWAIITDARGSIVANVNSETGPDATSCPATRKMPSTANARLISAAPELLAALERAAEAFHDAAQYCSQPDHEKRYWSALETDTRDAIAKATT